MGLALGGEGGHGVITPATVAADEGMHLVATVATDASAVTRSTARLMRCRREL